ncbi:MAG: hypothetical protein LQ343_005829 [Gyalolechia ehrenbergii]|nr:MAG: hypothetical protein LQ343_005829 [Gyalolechia ehrenbergii]
MCRTTLLKLTAICLLSTFVPQTTALSAAVDAAQVYGLLSRQTSTCATAGYSPCNKPGIPSSFCCPSGTTCTAFNNNKSVVCCPSGRDCKTISPLTCDLSQQNASLHPDNELHSTDLTGTLQTCGINTCCPKGFTCSNGQCVMQAAASSSAKPASTTTSRAAASSKPASTSASSTSKPSSSASKSASAASETSSAAAATSTKKENKFTAAAVLAGFFPGMLLGALLTVAIIICIGRRRTKREEKDGDFGSVAATVSDPIYQDTNGFRTDFLRRESKTKYSNRTSRVRSLFSRSNTLKSSNSDGYATNILPKTPENRRTPETKREPSMESIKIYSPPNGGLQRPNTTFTEMMADAGFRNGEPYLGSPGRVEPRARGGY